MDFLPLAGVCTYEEASQIGHSVDESVHRLVRYAWIKKRTMDMGLFWLNSTPEWELKEALSLHLYLDAEHVSMIRRRVSEMRNPPPRMDRSPTVSLDTFLDEVLWASDTLERIVGLYGVLKPALLEALRRHIERINPLVGYPTRRLLRLLIADEEEAVVWGQHAVTAVTGSGEQQARAETWSAHLAAYLDAAGGIMGDINGSSDRLPPTRAKGLYQPDYFPRRDRRFKHQDNFIFPPHEVARTDGVPAEEKTLALMCKRALEMDVPEVMAPMIAEAEDQPWEYYTDMCRQLWDEARHAMMGSVYFEKHGIDWKGQIPLHAGFPIRSNIHMSPLEAHTVLYAIEQSLMPAKTGKRYEWATAGEAQDELATLFQDYDWADEVLHTQIGRRWLVSQLDMSRDEIIELGQTKAIDTEEVLDEYTDEARQVNWWPEFVRQVLGRKSQMDMGKVTTGDPVYRKAGKE